MRVLGWMHHRSKKTSIEPFKDFLIGNYCTCFSAAKSPIDDHACYARKSTDSRYGSRLLSQPNKEYENSSSENESVDENNRDETTMINSNLFHGFLAIGTLGSESITSEPATPTFPISMENVAQETIEVTENDLKLVNDELEKFLEAEAEEEGYNESLARSSYVSTITLSGMQMEATDAQDYGKTVVCPLQGYLFGSSIELPETTSGVKERVSLGEMFLRTKVTDEICSEKKVKGELQAKKANKSAKYLIKKILTKFHKSSENPAPDDEEAVNSVSTKKKFNKVLKMFHRKVHPENPMAEKGFMKSKDKKMSTLNNCGYNADLMRKVKDKRRFIPGSQSMEGLQSHKNNLELHHYYHIFSDSSTNGEHWIKTDADYLVLEL